MQTNFSFLSNEFPEVYAEIVQAERFVYTQPRYSALLSRTTIEKAILWLYEHEAYLDLPYDTSLSALIHNFEFKNLIPQSIFVELNIVRRTGNKGAHGERVSGSEAMTSLKHTFRFLSWVSKLYSEEDPVIPAFDEALIPKGEEEDKSKKELQKLSEKYEEDRKKYEVQLKRKLELELENEELRKQVLQQEKLLSERKQQREEKYVHVEQAIPPLTSEYETRKQLIDFLLYEAGWRNLRKGVDLEYELKGMPKSTNPSGIGYVDYVLWGDDGKPLAIVEAKASIHDSTKGKHQAFLYAECLEQMTGQRPIIFYSNGFETNLWDDNFYPPRKVSGFYTKDELQTLIRRRGQQLDLREYEADLDIAGRPYQLQAIQAVAENLVATQDDKIIGKHRKSLLVMATGSGKTRVAASIVEMLIRNNWVKRVLFLADRNALVTQAKNSFKEHLPNLSAIDLTKGERDLNARVVFSTYPTMMNQIDSVRTDGQKTFGIAHFDLIIIDEAHRSVYQKYQAIFDYFDSLLIGLTATPVKHVDRNTYDLFELEEDNPTFAYELEQAVKDGFLVPPKGIDVPVKFVRSGVKYKDLSEEEKKQFEELYGIDSVTDEEAEALEVGKSKINQFLFNNDTVDKVLDLLFEKGLKIESGTKLGKTIIFAKNHRHAVFIAERFYKNYPEYGGDFLEVIDNYNDKAQDLLERFCFDKGEEKMPQIAVSVDMMDTGVDAPRVLNLVFFKEVKSYAKYWQMIGRGTRLCPNIFGPGESEENHKQEFLIFDICGNIEYFGEKPEEYSASPRKSLNQILFEAQLAVASVIQSNPDASEEDLAYAEASVSELYNKVNSLDESRFIVRKHWELVKKYKQKKEWEVLIPDKVHDMAMTLGTLVDYGEDTDERAKRFDVMIYQLELAIIQGGKNQTKLMKGVTKLGEQLLRLRNIPSVRQQEVVLRSLVSPDYWEGINVKRLERLRTDLRDLMQFLKNEKEQPLYSNFIDELDYSKIKTVEVMDDERPTLENYKARVEHFIRQHKHHLVIDKIYKNLPISASELKELESFLTHEKFELTKIEREFETKSLTQFVRKVLGLDKEAVQKHFAQFIQEENLSNNQIQFMNIVINYLSENGMIDRLKLTGSPFSNVVDQGIMGAFKDDSKLRKVVQLIDELNEVKMLG